MIRHLLALMICAVLISGCNASVIPNSSINQPPFNTMVNLPLGSYSDVWLGGSSDWNDSAYWSAGVPTFDADVVVGANGNLSLGNAGGEAGSLNNAGTIGLAPGDVILTVNGAVTNSGTISIDGNEESGGSFANFGSLVNSGTVQVGYPSGVRAGNLTNTGIIEGYAPFVGDVSASELNNSGSIVIGSLEAGNLSNSGSIQVFNATVGGNLNNSGSFVASGSSQMPGEITVHGNLNNSGQITTDSFSTFNIGNRLTDAAAGSLRIDGAYSILNVGSMVNQGTAYIGPETSLNVTGGPRAVGSALAGFVNSGIVDIDWNGNLNVSGNYTQTAGRTTIDGTLQVRAGGTANFAGGSVYGYQGTIRGPVVSNAAINMGDQLMSVGQLSFLGNYTQGARGSLTFDIAGSAPGQYDQLNIAGQARLNGLMTVNLLGGFVPALGNTFDIMNFSSRSGTFSTVVGLPINGQEHFVLEYDPTDLTLDVVAGAFTGQSSQAGWVANKSSSEPFVTTGDVAVGLAASNSNAVGSSPTPEPGSMVLLGSGLLCVAYALRRRWGSW